MTSIIRERADQEIREDGYLLDPSGQPRSSSRSGLLRDDHCCDRMYEQVYADDYLIYNSMERYWALITRSPWVEQLNFCPFCCAKLPKDLQDEILVHLKATVKGKLTEEFIDNIEQWPSEFQTDEWWKKRGL